MKEKIVFFGSSKFVIPILQSLQKNFDLSLVVTTENPKALNVDLASQGQALRSWPVVEYCVENKIPYRSVSSLSDFTINHELSTINPIVGVLADFGLIIPQPVLNLFPKGIINIHPSLLPKYRGPTPVQTAILNGEKTAGVTIIKLDEKIDHGPILEQEKEDILDTDTSESLYKRLFEKGSNLLLKVLPNYINGSLHATPQNHNQATFTKHLTRQDGYVDMSKLKTQNSKLKLERMIRAYYPWPSVWTKLRIAKRELRIKLLPGQKIQVEGKKPMSYKDFINGYPQIKQQLGKLLGQLV